MFHLHMESSIPSNARALPISIMEVVVHRIAVGILLFLTLY